MKPDIPKLITGGSFVDERGQIDFVNDFDSTSVKRIYFTTNSDINFIRAWQGHKIESRWFFCVKGSFKVKLVAIDNWVSPSNDCEIFEYYISEETPEVLYIPSGYLNGFQALEEDSKLMIMSDALLGENPEDNFRFNLNKFRWE